MLDLPAPFFDWLDVWMASIPPIAKIAIFAAGSAGVWMGIYAVLSPQRRILESKREAAASRRALLEFEGDLSQARPLMRQAVRSPLRQLGLTLFPALAATLPIVSAIVWLSASYSYRFPALDESVQVSIVPKGFTARLDSSETDAARVRRLTISDSDDTVITRLDLARPIPTLVKRQWWHIWAGSPLIVLPRSGPVERVELGWPRQELHSMGPPWIRYWESIYFAVLTACSLAIRKLAGIA